MLTWGAFLDSCPVLCYAVSGRSCGRTAPSSGRPGRAATSGRASSPPAPGLWHPRGFGALLPTASVQCGSGGERQRSGENRPLSVTSLIQLAAAAPPAAPRCLRARCSPRRVLAALPAPPRGSAHRARPLPPPPGPAPPTSLHRAAPAGPARPTSAPWRQRGRPAHARAARGALS